VNNVNNRQGQEAIENPVNNFYASLSPTPRTVYILWQEFQVDMEGRKAAKLFTPQEQGQCKSKYLCCKVIWDIILELVCSGLTANVAIDQIYQVYGRLTTVMTIINRI